MECLCCHKKSVGEIPIADEAGIHFCEEHEYEIRLAFLMVKTGNNVKALENLIERKRQSHANKNSE